MCSLVAPGERTDRAKRAGLPGHLRRQGGEPAVRHPHPRLPLQGLRPAPAAPLPTQAPLIRYFR